MMLFTLHFFRAYDLQFSFKKVAMTTILLALGACCLWQPQTTCVQAVPMLRNMRECVAVAVQDGRMTAEAVKSLLMRHRARLAGVTDLT